jgi:MFS family permease
MPTETSDNNIAVQTSSTARILAAICVAHLVSHFHMLVLPPLFPFLKDQLHVSYIDLGFALTLFGIVSAVTQAPVGMLVDQLGARMVLIIGLVLGGLSFMVFGLTLSYPGLIACGLIAGLANSVYHPANYSILSAQMDPSRMGHAFSVHTFAGFLGGAIAPATIYFIAATASVASAVFVAGAMGMLGALLIAATPLPRASNATSTERVATSASLASVVTPAILALAAFFTLLALSTGGISSFGVAALVTGYGVSASSANIALTTFLGASAIGVLVGGQLADRTARHGDVAAIAFAANALLILIIAAVSLSTPAIIAIMGLAGFLGGIVAPSRDMMVRKAAPAGATGRAFGLVSTGFNVAGIIGPLLFGYIMDQQLPRWVFGISAMFMITTVALIVVTELKTKVAVD